MFSPKFITQSDGVLEEENAATSSTADSVVATNSAGLIDASFFPAGISDDVATATASEALAAGDLVNFHIASSALRVRKADASAASTKADGFVLTAVNANATATIYQC